jgi:hypothetical protein
MTAEIQSSQSVPFTVQIANKVGQIFSYVNRQSYLGKKFSDDFISEVQGLLELGFNTEQLIARYSRVSVPQIYKIKSSFDFFGHIIPLPSIGCGCSIPSRFCL